MPLYMTSGNGGMQYGVLAPRVGLGSFAAQNPAAVTPEQAQAMTQRMFNTQYNENRGISWTRGFMNSVLGSAIDLGDTLASSVGGVMLPAGVPKPERGDIWNLVGQYGGSEGKDLLEYYGRNQSRIELISGITGAIGTGYLAGELLLPKIAQSFASSTAISSSRLWLWGARTNALTRANMIAAQQEAAMAGEAFSMWANPAGRSFLRLQAGKGAAKGLFEETVIGLTMHTNQAIWSDDMSTNFFWGGIGLGVGGLVGTAAARAEMRALANDPAMVTLREDAIDPQGFTSLRENTPHAAALSQMRNVEAKESANLTSLALEWRQATPSTADPKIAARFDSLRKQAREMVGNSMQKLSTKGIQLLPNTRFNIDMTELGSAGKHVTDLLHDDPLALFGLDSMGVIRRASPESVDAPLYTMLQDRADAIKQLRKPNALGIVKAGNIRLANKLEKQQAMLLVNNRMIPADTPEAYAFSRYEPGRIQLKRQSGTSEITFLLDNSPNNMMIRVNEDFNPRIGRGNVAFEALPLDHKLQVREAMLNVFDSMLRKRTLHVVPPRPTWFQLDAAIAFHKRGGAVTWGNAGIKSIDDARLMSLRLKAAALMTNAKLGGYFDRLSWNLPLPTTAERIYDASGDSMRVLLQAADQGAPLDKIMALREQINQLQGFNFRTVNNVLDGDFFDFNLDRGRWKTPVVGFYDTAAINKPLSPFAIAAQNAEIKAARFHQLTSPKQGAPTLVPEMTRAIVNMPEFQTSLSLRGLSDDQVTGLGHALSQAAGEILTREFRYRDNPVMLAALRVREAANRMSDEYLFNISKGLSQIQKELAAAPAGASKTLVNQYLSNTSGWDIKGVAPIPGQNYYGIVLETTSGNAQRLGRPVQKGELLVNPRTGKHIVLDDLALRFIDELNAVTRRILDDTNRVRIARGLPEIAYRRYYTPPRTTRDKFVAFTFDEEGKTVPGHAIIASTQAEYERLVTLKNREIAGDPTKKGWTIHSKKQLEDTADMWDRAAMDWIDPSVGYAPAKTQTGALASDLVNPNAVGDTLEWLKRRVEDLGTNTLKTLYDSNLGIARARGAVEREVKNTPSTIPVRTVWDEYEATILGKNLADLEKSITGPVAKGIESRINLALNAVWPALKWMSPAHASQWIFDAAARMGAPVPSNVKSFSQLVNHLGPYSPYKNMMDYVDQNFKVVQPPEIRDIAQNINRMSAALVLRYFELPVAAMNMLGVITNMPSILQSGRAPISTVLTSGGKRYGVLDSMKIMMESMRDLTRMSKHPDWNYMVKNGDTTQQVADFNKQLSTVTDQASWKRVFLGDKTIDAKNIKDWRSAKDATDAMKNKGVDGLISVLTDTTENWSRTWAHFAGLRLADLQGITGLEARHSFAREIANATIANYNPMNRPELFQSAFGSMFGLFMSYMQSYNQRLFRWMEKGDYASIGRQLGMQASLFGLASLPGFNAIQSALLAAGIGETESGEEATLLDNLYARLGPTVGSAFAHGGLSELGVALYTRGDMNYRAVTLDPSKLMAGIGLITDAATAVQEAASVFLDPNSLDGNNSYMEILARNMPNRVLKGILTQIANGGQDVDIRGQIITENRNFFESALRMIGLRSTYQQGRIEAFYANRSLQDREAARMDSLRLETRALIRNAPDWQSRIQEVFQRYLAVGGRPEHFRTWIRDQLRASTNSRDMNALVKAFQNPKSQLEVWRYGAYAPN